MTRNERERERERAICCSRADDALEGSQEPRVSEVYTLEGDGRIGHMDTAGS